MNQVEYTALITVINSLKSQLSGLETLVATIANVGKEHKATKPTQKNSDYSDSLTLTDEEETLLANHLQFAEDMQIKRMEAEAKKHFESSMQEIADKDTK